MRSTGLLFTKQKSSLRIACLSGTINQNPRHRMNGRKYKPYSQPGIANLGRLTTLNVGQVINRQGAALILSVDSASANRGLAQVTSPQLLGLRASFGGVIAVWYRM